MTERGGFSPQDYEWLSAYIDGELDASEVTTLEARLRDEPQLRVEYESLRQTVGLINQMPPLKAPRNFMLTADMVAQRRASPKVIPLPRQRFSPVLSSLAAAVFVFLFGGVFLLSQLQPQATLSTGASEAGAPTFVADAPALEPTEEAEALDSSNTARSLLGVAESTAETATNTLTQPLDGTTEIPGGADDAFLGDTGAGEENNDFRDDADDGAFRSQNEPMDMAESDEAEDEPDALDAPPAPAVADGEFAIEEANLQTEDVTGDGDADAPMAGGGFADPNATGLIPPDNVSGAMAFAPIDTYTVITPVSNMFDPNLILTLTANAPVAQQPADLNLTATTLMEGFVEATQVAGTRDANDRQETRSRTSDNLPLAFMGLLGVSILAGLLVYGFMRRNANP